MFCDKPCKNSHGAKIHARKCQHRPDPQKFNGTCADKCVRKQKVEEAQKKKPKAKCEETFLKNVAVFKYLDSLFYPDGTHGHDVSRHIALAMSRCGKLRQVFDSETLSLKL